MMPFERLKAWHACHALWIAVYYATQRWPVTERYGLASQIKRAALSSGANIAEGVAKRGPRDCARHFNISNISIGSLAEVACALIAARDVKIIGPAEYERLSELQQNAGRLIMGLYRGLQRTIRARHTNRPTDQPTNRLTD